MDKLTASRIVTAAKSLDRGLGEIDSAISEMKDEAERRELAGRLGEVLRVVNTYFIRPIVRDYPDLDPDK